MSGHLDVMIAVALAIIVLMGVGLFFETVGDARFGIVGPIVMTFMLMRVSGVPILERGLSHPRTAGPS